MKTFVDLCDIKLGRNYSRPHGVGDVSELAAAMEEMQLQPVILSSDGFLAMGFRRFAAAQKLGWDSIWAESDSRPIAEMKDANLIENLCRKDMTLWEEIQSIRDVYGENPSIREVSRKLKKSRNWVKPRVDAWRLPQNFLDDIRLNKIDISRLRGRLNNSREPTNNTSSNFHVNPTQKEIRNAVSRLLERGRRAEATALSYALGTIDLDRLLSDESEAA